MRRIIPIVLVAMCLAPAAQASQRAPNAYSVVGKWLGPGIGAKKCGAQYDEWSFFRNGKFTFTMKSDSSDCADVTFWGRYQVKSATVIKVRPTGSPCGSYCTPPPFPMKYRFVTKNALRLCGYAGSACFLHHRQR
jgi:hypothetical protein